MRGKEMLEAVGYLDEELIVQGERSKTVRNWKRWGALAAAFCVVLGGVFLYRRSLPQYGTELISIADFGAAMGQEAYQVYDIGEIRRDNPSDGKTLRALHVYRSTISYDERQYPYGQDLDAMQAYLLSLAAKLGLEVDAQDIQDNTPGEKQMLGLEMEFASRGLEVPEYYQLPTKLWVQTEKVKITVEADMTATVSFTDGISVPDGYYFDYDASPEELSALSEWLWAEYGDLIGYETPQLCIDGGDYSTTGEQSYTLIFYEGSRDKTGNFENYSFNYAEFSPRIIRIHSDMALEEIGLYPLIDEEQARELLLNGQYYTNVTEAFPGEEAVVRCELVYRGDSDSTLRVPFYRFYVYLETAPGTELYPEGMKTYGAYYVPAVDPSYLQES